MESFDREYIISNICDHFAFQEDIDSARNMSIDFVMDYLKRYGMNADCLSNIICAINSLWLFCKNESRNEK